MTTTEAPTVTTTDAIAYLELGRIAPSKTNPRGHMNGAAFTELLESVRAHGVLQPILVRPVKKGKAEFEIVAGHRRFEAASQAERPSIPAMVRELTDEQALELQLIENLTRADLHPLEEAHGYQQLMAFSKQTVARIAERIGRSVAYVYDRVKLLNLIDELRQHFLEGTITAGHAVILARLKPADQKRAMKVDDNPFKPGALFQHERLLFDPEQRSGARRDSVKTRSVRELQAWVDEHVRFEAKEADPMLFPETAAEVAEAKKIIPITHSHYIQPESREGRTFGPRSWKRADGQKKSKTCEYSVTGFIAVGPGRGQAFAVCVAKDKCLVHWGAETRARARAAARPSASNSPKPKPVDTRLRDALDKARNEAFEAISAAVMKNVGAMKPEKFLRLFAASRWEIGDYLRDVLNKPNGHQSVDTWVAKAPISEIQKALAFGDIQEGGDDAAKGFGVDPAPIFKAAEARARAAVKAKPGKPTAGTCSKCGCTEEAACEGGCGWANKEKTLCTSCAPAPKPTKAGKRHVYTEEQKRMILQFAKKDGLTAAQVQKKYGVKPVTYYTWRKAEQASPAKRGKKK